MSINSYTPEILAPAGNKESFFAALDAGADSIYCGLKNFSARMEAENFSLSDLAGLADLAKQNNCKTYIAFNSLLKSSELNAAGKLLDRIISLVKPEGLIVQDLALLSLARQCRYKGAIHLSTLANAASIQALTFLTTNLQISRLVLPRELNLEEIQTLAQHCPKDLELEVFVHGALCYAVSGRCYWSSFLGGKSSLRGRCVQPCRRIYSHQGENKRFFSCLDLGLDVLSKTLLKVPQVKAWKIEGRKKGPHYIYHTVTAYRLIRDYPEDPKAKKQAKMLLDNCLGRKFSHYYFLPQSPHIPLDPDQENSSGLFLGKVSLSSKDKPFTRPREELLPGDLLRIGYQDRPGHSLHKVRTYVPKGKKEPLPKCTAPKGTPIFLVDRRQAELEKILKNWQSKFLSLSKQKVKKSSFQVTLPKTGSKPVKSRTMIVSSQLHKGKSRDAKAIWLSPAQIRKLSKTVFPSLWFWIPPVIWPNQEEKWQWCINTCLKYQATNFVLNTPWQISLFPEQKKIKLWAGPFCNLSNPLALQKLKDLGFSGAFVSPELGKEELLSLPKESPLPLGLLLKGSWPTCISRTLSPEIKQGLPILSPKNELFYVVKKDLNYYLYPNWDLDLSGKKEELEKAGYSWLAIIKNSRPKQIPAPKRSSEFNWDIGLV